MTMKTPGVYIVEQSAFPNSVVQVETALPAFIGYTERALNGHVSLHGTPRRITSLHDFHTYFGTAPVPEFALKPFAPRTGPSPLSPEQADMPPELPQAAFSVATPDGPEKFELLQTNPAYALYGAIKLFFQNGGGKCYVTSIGSYTDAIEAEPMKAALTRLEKEPEPTMIIIPEVTRLSHTDAMSVQREVLRHCGTVMRDRFAILDIPGGHLAQDDPRGAPVARFRETIGDDNLGFGAAYYPWLNTTIFSARDFSFLNLRVQDRKTLVSLLKRAVSEDEQLIPEIDRILTAEQPDGPPPSDIDKTIRATVPLYAEIMHTMATYINTMAPAAALAGIYTAVDNTRGVWKAPANLSLSAVASPTIDIGTEEQENLNVDMTGKSINAIRPFLGEGTLVWGARTLDGNSNDWRYINVRRTMLMIEESLRLAAKAFVFEANVAQTWVAIRSMMENYLTNVWKQGGLYGATPAEAFSVNVGLGETMTGVDILEGRLRVEVMVAVVRPAEFIVIAFEQQMQTS